MPHGLPSSLEHDSITVGNSIRKPAIKLFVEYNVDFILWEFDDKVKVFALQNLENTGY